MADPMDESVVVAPASDPMDLDSTLESIHVKENQNLADCQPIRQHPSSIWDHSRQLPPSVRASSLSGSKHLRTTNLGNLIRPYRSHSQFVGYDRRKSTLIDRRPANNPTLSAAQSTTDSTQIPAHLTQSVFIPHPVTPRKRVIVGEDNQFSRDNLDSSRRGVHSTRKRPRTSHQFLDKSEGGAVSGSSTVQPPGQTPIPQDQLPGRWPETPAAIRPSTPPQHSRFVSISDDLGGATVTDAFMTGGVLVTPTRDSTKKNVPISPPGTVVPHDYLKENSYDWDHIKHPDHIHWDMDPKAFVENRRRSPLRRIIPDLSTLPQAIRYSVTKPFQVVLDVGQTLTRCALGIFQGKRAFGSYRNQTQDEAADTTSKLPIESSFVLDKVRLRGRQATAPSYRQSKLQSGVVSTVSKGLLNRKVNKSRIEKTQKRRVRKGPNTVGSLTRFPGGFVLPWYRSTKPFVDILDPLWTAYQQEGVSDEYKSSDITFDTEAAIDNLPTPPDSDVELELRTLGEQKVESALATGKARSRGRQKQEDYKKRPLRTELVPFLKREPFLQGIEDDSSLVPENERKVISRPDKDVRKVQAAISTEILRHDIAQSHRPQGIHWLQSDTPLGRPISSVRLFNPLSPLIPGRRAKALYEAEWKEIEKAKEMLRPVLRDRSKERAVRPLLTQWEARVDESMTASDSTPLATTIAGHPLTRYDLYTCYRRGAWLNDEVINGYLALVVDYLRHGSGKSGKEDPKSPKYHAFNSFFFSNLREKGFNAIRRWTTRAKIGGDALLQVDTVFVPVHQGAHWTLIVVRPKARSIAHYDSLGSLSPIFVKIIKEWLRGELGPLYKDDEWKILPSISPQQNNGSDCGVFLLTTAKAVAVGLEPVVYGPPDITILRKKIIAELMNGGLTGEFEPVGEFGELSL